MAHRHVYGCRDRDGRVWSITYDDSWTASGRWVVFRDGRRWVERATREEAMDEIREHCAD